MRPVLGGFSFGAVVSLASSGLADESDLAAQVRSCWTVGAVSQDARAVALTVAFELDQNAVPLKDSVQLIGAGKDTRPAVLEAYGAARLAILRCGQGGFRLPLANHDEWRNIEMTFTPEGMQMR